MNLADWDDFGNLIHSLLPLVLKRGRILTKTVAASDLNIQLDQPVKRSVQCVHVIFDFDIGLRARRLNIFGRHADLRGKRLGSAKNACQPGFGFRMRCRLGQGGLKGGDPSVD